MNIVDVNRKTYGLAKVVPYINWEYFYFAWQVKDTKAQDELKANAMVVLSELAGKYHTHVLFAIADANSDGDDLVVEGTRIPMLRQQSLSRGEKHCLCLADFIRPKDSGITDRVGLFAATVDIGMEKDFASDDYMRLMVGLLADRLAEATAECLHEEVRKHYWGYASDESLQIKDLHAEKFVGIRPAIGYPSLPDASINFILAELLDFKAVGIRLTESGAMKPHASVSGFMMANPNARYFSVGEIGKDQLEDYARRRGLPVGMVKRFVVSNLR